MILFKKKEGECEAQKIPASEKNIKEDNIFAWKAKKLVAEAILSYGEKALSVSPGKKIWILCGEDTAALYQGDDCFIIQVLGNPKEPLSMTHNLFRLLRKADEEDVELILGECYSEEGVGFALMNRMKKAAGQRIFYV